MVGATNTITPVERRLAKAVLVLAWVVILAASIFTYVLSHSWTVTGIFAVFALVVGVMVTYALGGLLGWWEMRVRIDGSEW